MSKMTRREAIKRMLVAAAATSALTSCKETPMIEKSNDDSSKSPIRMQASKWSELPDVLKQYEAMLDKETSGVSRIFGYASLITNHVNEKPPGSAALENERAQLQGMEVAMNVLAAGEYEF